MVNALKSYLLKSLKNFKALSLKKRTFKWFSKFKIRKKFF